MTGLLFKKNRSNSNASPRVSEAKHWKCLGLMVLLFSPLFASANVVINEIAWMGTANSYTDEWMELKNTSGESVDLAGWVLEAEDGQPSIILEGVVAADGYYLLERSDDSTVPQVPADIIYTGALSNSGEILKLKDAAGAIIDEVNAIDGWPAGDNTTKETMQFSGSEWISAEGTPGAENALGGENPNGDESGGEIENGNDSLPESDSGGRTEYIPPEYIPRITAYAGEDKDSVTGGRVLFEGIALGYDGKELDYSRVRFLWNFGDGKLKDGRNISHIYRYPGTYVVRLSVVNGNDATEDSLTVNVKENPIIISEILPGTDSWVELYNPSGEEINMSGWKLTNNAEDKFVLPLGTIIKGKSFIVLSHDTTGIKFSYGNISASLISPDGKIADSFDHINIKAKSSSAFVSGMVIIGDPTPGHKNIKIITNKTISTNPTIHGSAPEKTKLIEKSDIEQGSLKEQLKEDNIPAGEDKEGVVKTETNSKNLASLPDSNNIYWLIISILSGVIFGYLAILARRRFLK